MSVTNAEINKLQMQIDGALFSYRIGEEVIKNDYNDLEAILISKTLEDDGSTVEHLPNSRDDPSRKMTEEDRRKTFSRLSIKYPQRAG